MTRSMLRTPLGLGALALALSAFPATLVRGQEVHKEGGQAHGMIPPSIQKEHEEIHSELVAATRLTGPVGAAARELAAVLHPHFVREEQIALPPLGMLRPLAEKREMTHEMPGMLAMTDSLRAELPRMLEEHKAIRAATIRLADVAKAAGNTRVVQLAEELKLHAQTEEEILYPAALAVGDLLRAHGRAH